MSRVDRVNVPAKVLAARYEAGMSLRALVTETGMAYGTIRERIRKQGVAMRSPGGYHPRPEQDEEPQVGEGASMNDQLPT